MIREKTYKLLRDLIHARALSHYVYYCSMLYKQGVYDA